VKKYLVSFSGLLFPGLGHVLMGRFAKGFLLFAVLTGMFVVGVTFDQDYFHRFGISPMGEQFPPIEDRGGSSADEGTIDMIWKYAFTYVFPFITGIGTYVVGFAMRDMVRPLVLTLGLAKDLATVPVTYKDIGYCFALLSGLLNVLVMMDAYDVAYNAELFKDSAQDRREKWLQ